VDNYKWGLIILLVLVVGCASVKTTVVGPQGAIYTVQSKKDALVVLKQGDMELTVDNRGKMGIFENLMGIMLMKTEINLKNKEGD
jgi:hypothetical protein